MMIQPLIALLQTGYTYQDGVSMHAATNGMYLLIIVIAIVGWVVQARLQSVFKK